MKFYQRFTTVEIGADEARQRFVNRMLYVVFPKYPTPYGKELQLASRALGETIQSINEFEAIIHDDFYRLLDLLERLVQILPEDNQKAPHLTAHALVNEIQQEIVSADIDLEVEWRDGKFFPRGARLLDARLVDDPLEWLNNVGLRSVYDPFRKALEHFLRSRNNNSLLSDSITDAYDALEAMAKEVRRKWGQTRYFVLSSRFPYPTQHTNDYGPPRPLHHSWPAAAHHPAGQQPAGDLCSECGLPIFP